jgi:FdhD protein
VFKHTGGLHASALINRKGEIELIREDIGRHNALDKLIGARAAAGKDNTESILFVSGRAGFELVQKAVVAGIPIMIAVGAPSSLAVELASSYDQTLIGFARGGKFNVYSGLSRVGV